MPNEKQFLEAWIRGVQIAGPQYFGEGGDPNLARSKWDLEPKSDLINEAIGHISISEAAFLAAMYCFYNDHYGAKLLQRAYASDAAIGICTIAAQLDWARRSVIGDLFMSYCGW